MPHRRQFTSAIKKITPLLILLLALFVQTQYLAELRETFPDSFASQPFCGVDAQAHVERALGLLDGSLPGNETYYFIPLYPFYLALLQKFFGSSLLFPVFIQVLLQLVGIAALYGLGRLTFSPLIGALAALGMATYKYYIFYLPCFDQALLTVPFLTLAVFFLVKYHRYQQSQYIQICSSTVQRPKRGLWSAPSLKIGSTESGCLLVAGIAFAAAALSRPTILAIFPPVIIWLYFIRRYRGGGTKGYKKSGLLLSRFYRWWPLGRDVIFLTLPFLIAVAPITWHNYRVSGRFILLSDNFDVNLFTGNNPDATGLDSLIQPQSQPAVMRFKEIYPRVEAGKTTLTAEVLRYITGQPGHWLTLIARKTWLWFGEIDERLVSPFFPLTVGQSRILTPLPLEWQAIVIVALLGVLLASWEGRPRQGIGLLWLVYGTLSVVTILFFIQLRFRLPFAPFVLLSAAALLASAPHWRHHCPWRFWTTLVVLLLLYPIVPPLWLFILLFTGLALWLGRPAKQVPTAQSVMSRRSSFVVRRSSFWLTAALCLYLLAVGLWVRAETLASDVSQTIDHYLGPPLAASGILGQTFQMDCDGLNRLEITLGVFDEQHNQPAELPRPVIFHLATDTSAQEILFSETFDGSLVKDYQRKSFSFPPIPDSAGRSFFFFIASPTSTPENAITARGYTDVPVDRYPAGSAWAGQLGSLQQFEADFAFAAYCDLNPWQKVWAALQTFFSFGG